VSSLTMNSLEQIRTIVGEILKRISDPEERRCACVHLYGVSLMTVFLARLERSLNVDFGYGPCYSSPQSSP
jgi:hypothetical protein